MGTAVNCPLCNQVLVESTENILMEPVRFGPKHTTHEQAKGHLGCVMDWEHDLAQDRWEQTHPNLVERTLEEQ